ncbi:hypothetical protein [Rhizobium sp. B21/90]|uniref:hypothetical protein n=1 Tax=Rhizobium sp. B21/90 TaxID=2819993 RepID=UPI0035A84333
MQADQNSTGNNCSEGDTETASVKVKIVRKDERIERLEKLVAAFKQAAFGAQVRED